MGPRAIVEVRWGPLAGTRAVLRPGDTLRLRAGRATDAGNDFTARHSRDAAQEAQRELARAAGSEVVAWNDPVAKLGVRALCAVRLAEP